MLLWTGKKSEVLIKVVAQKIPIFAGKTVSRLQNCMPYIGVDSEWDQFWRMV
jgi:hypothetical protein